MGDSLSYLDNLLYPVISKSVQLPISVSSIKSQLSITLKKSGFCNLFPRHLEDSPLIVQPQKDNLLDISGQTLVLIIDIDIISSSYWYKIYSSITLSVSMFK